VHDLLPYIERGEPVEKEYRIRNVDRSIPVKLNYHIAVRYRDEGLPPDTIRLVFRGTAGQSFGAFNHKGLTLTLIGEANDYVAKGMYGGKIIIRPAGVGDPHKQVIAGNTVLYGATGGEFYGAGRAGERFAVRNSGATAVIEGAGHHLCEYMTKGTVVVLGDAGCNIGAGMTGGVLYLNDEFNILACRLNTAYVYSAELKDGDEIKRLQSLIEHHYRNTGSLRAESIINNFGQSLRSFMKIVPLIKEGTHH
jgi:glutamate synthase (NADPH/NADH) large chain